MKVINTRMHGILDYLSVATLLALPRMLGWSDRVTTLLTVMAVGTLIYSLLTRYELGAFKALPMQAHLVLDFMSGALLLGAALMLGDEPNSVRMGLGLLGLFEIGAALMTDPTTSVAGESAPRTRASGF